MECVRDRFKCFMYVTDRQGWFCDIKSKECGVSKMCSHIRSDYTGSLVFKHLLLSFCKVIEMYDRQLAISSV